MKKKVFSFILVLSLLLGSFVFADASADDCNQWYHDGEVAIEELLDAYDDYRHALQKGNKKKAKKAQERMYDALSDFWAAKKSYHEGNCIEVTGKTFPASVTLDEMGF